MGQTLLTAVPGSGHLEESLSWCLCFEIGMLFRPCLVADFVLPVTRISVLTGSLPLLGTFTDDKVARAK